MEDMKEKLRTIALTSAVVLPLLANIGSYAADPAKSNACIGRYISAVDDEFINKYGCVTTDDCLELDRGAGSSLYDHGSTSYNGLICFSMISNEDGRLTYNFFHTYKHEFHKSIPTPPYVETDVVHVVQEATLHRGKKTDCVGDEDFYISRGFQDGQYFDQNMWSYSEAQLCTAVVGGIPNPLVVKMNPYWPWPNGRDQSSSNQSMSANHDSQPSYAPAETKGLQAASFPVASRPQLYETLSDTPFYFRIK
jgi:hypothetical protein